MAPLKMKEIEVKILDINVEEVKQKLHNLGAEKLFSSMVEMIRFDFPDENLTKQGKFLRIRKMNDKTELCFKGKKEDSKFKVREEVEVETTNFEDTIKIFEKIGMKRFYEGTKHRESYKLGKIKFEIDTWKEIPTFLEIEAPCENDVIKAVELMGFTIEQTSNLSLKEIIKEYQKYKPELVQK